MCLKFSGTYTYKDSDTITRIMRTLIGRDVAVCLPPRDLYLGSAPRPDRYAWMHLVLGGVACGRPVNITEGCGGL